MKYIILIGAIFFVACKSNETQTASQSKIHLLYIDTSRYAVLDFNSKEDSGLFARNSKSAKLNADEVDQIERIIADTVSKYNSKIKSYNKKYADIYPLINRPDKYYKQLITVTNPQGEKEVWVNCFCYSYLKTNNRDTNYWKRGIVMVQDGGSCFFQLKINLSKNLLEDFNVNGSG